MLVGGVDLPCDMEGKTKKVWKPNPATKPLEVTRGRQRRHVTSRTPAKVGKGGEARGGKTSHSSGEGV